MNRAWCGDRCSCPFSCPVFLSSFPVKIRSCPVCPVRAVTSASMHAPIFDIFFRLALISRLFGFDLNPHKDSPPCWLQPSAVPLRPLYLAAMPPSISLSVPWPWALLKAERLAKNSWPNWAVSQHKLLLTASGLWDGLRVSCFDLKSFT